MTWSAGEALGTARLDHAGMVAITGGQFHMGSDRFYPEERPSRAVTVDQFKIDVTPVTNAQFAAFVEATGHRTLAETAPDPTDYPGMPPELARPASAVFEPSDWPVNLHDPSQWWLYTFGADWQHPRGPGSSIDGLEDHPVVHIGYADAEAYAAWAGKALPTEAEWECAARGGLDNMDYAWGNSAAGGPSLANYWQGAFPLRSSLPDRWTGTSPVGSYTANGYGLFDMIGNVWEWTADWWALPPAETKSCCVPDNPRGGTLSGSLDPAMAQLGIGRKVLKGGSHLCADQYCRRYRPAARQAQMIDSTTSHIGFRCVMRLPCS